MNNKLNLLLFFLIFSCQKNTNENFVKINGKIENPIINTNITIRSNQIDLAYGKSDYEKIINVSDNGQFSDTLSTSNGEYELFYNGNSSSINLENGYDLIINLDSKEITKTINYSGTGYEKNQFNSDKQRLLQEFDKLYSQNEITNVDSFIKIELLDKHKLLIEKYSGKIFDSILSVKEKKFNDFFSNDKYAKLYLKKLKSSKSKTILIGQLAKDFSFEGKNGKIISLSEFKGKYVFIDIWATWCGPCKFQMPYLEKIQNEFKNKNIVFISISIDNSRDKAKWLNFIDKENSSGIELFENENGKSEFISSLNSNSIPRYLIINPAGEFVNLDAPKPSYKKQLIDLMNSLLN